MKKSILSLSCCLTLALFAQQRQPQMHTHWYGGWWPVIKTTTTVPRKPWKEGDAIYERNKSGVSHKTSDREKARRKAANAESEARQRERDARIDRNVLEQRLTVQANRAQLESDRRTAEAERRVAADQRLGEIRARAAEQAATLSRIQSEQAAKYERAMASLKTCQALNADGSPCRRKANPGLRYCYLHVDYDKVVGVGEVEVEGEGVVGGEGRGGGVVGGVAVAKNEVKVETQPSPPTPNPQPSTSLSPPTSNPQPSIPSPQVVYEERVNWPLTILAGTLAVVCIVVVVALLVVVVKLLNGLRVEGRG